MNNLKWYERLIISTTLTGAAFVLCFFWQSNIWIEFGIGSFGYQIIDHVIGVLKFKIGQNVDKNN